MRRIAFVTSLVLISFVACSRFEQQRDDSVARKADQLFVATNGNDAWSGTIASPNRRGTDGPFQSLSRALQVAAEHNETRVGLNGVSIFVRAGTYWLSEPLVITPQHSGTASAPLLIAGYRNERPVISAGRPITGWKEVTIDGKALWTANVPEARNGWFFHQLWINGQRRTRARHPNSGYFSVAGLPDGTPSWEHGHKRFQFKEGDLKNWKSAGEGEAVAMVRWVESRLPITAIDEKERILTSSKRSVFQLEGGSPYYVEHIFEALDQPGEWFLDRREALLYYMPLPGETLAGFTAVAPRLMECMRIEGNPQAGQFAEHVRFNNLTFSHNEWYYPTNFGSTERHISSTPDPEIYGSAQAAFIVPGAVRAEGARNCTFERCKFTNIGSYGLQLGRGCQSNLVSRCDFFDLAAGGIRLGETILRTNAVEQAHGNEVSDCNIHDGGKMFHSGEGIWIGQSFNNRIAHNSIHDFFYTAISIGWTWGYEDSLASNNIVEFNHAHHIGQKSNGDGPILGDMGIIYTLGMQPGTTIRNNLFHDVVGRYFGWGLYFDEGASYILAENNVVFRTTHGGFHQHYGKENILRNNVFAFGRDQQLQRSRPEDHSSFTFERNIVYFDTGKLLEGDWDNGKYSQDYNLYFDARTNAPGLNFISGLEVWRKKGRDVHSVIGDPRFATTNLSSFSLLPDSPALGLGFKPFDIRSVGPRPPAPR